MLDDETFELISGVRVKVPISPENTINDSQFVFIPQRNEPEWDYVDRYQFCGYCGNVLVDYGEVESFDRRDGTKVITHYVQCTEYGPYRFGDHERWLKVLRS